MQILVAEDDKMSMTIICQILDQLGYEAIKCKDGSEAWKKYQELSPRICLIDWEMPEMNGIELCRKISEVDPDCQKIMFTVRGDKADLLKALQAGATDYITKPAEANQFRLRLQVAEMNLERLQAAKSKSA